MSRFGTETDSPCGARATAQDDLLGPAPEAGSRRHEHWAVAGLLIGQYGAAAGEEVRARIARARAAGDEETATIWCSVSLALANAALRT